MKSYPALCFHDSRNYRFIYPHEIVHIKSEGSYSTVFLSSNKKITVCRKLKDLALSLPNELFFRVHNCDIINLMYITGLSKTASSEIHLSNNSSVKLSRRKKAEFLQRFIKI